jgi:hypothetical protein
MSNDPFEPTPGWFKLWCGFVVGLCLILPTLLRLEREGWTAADLLFLVPGALLVIFCPLRLISLRRNRQREALARA